MVFIFLAYFTHSEFSANIFPVELGSQTKENGTMSCMVLEPTKKVFIFLKGWKKNVFCDTLKECEIHISRSIGKVKKCCNTHSLTYYLSAPCYEVQVEWLWQRLLGMKTWKYFTIWLSVGKVFQYLAGNPHMKWKWTQRKSNQWFWTYYRICICGCVYVCVCPRAW